MVQRLPPRQLLVIMALALLGVLAGGGGLYYTQYQHVLSMARQELHTIAQLKVDEIVGWRQEHLADAAALADTLFAEVVKYWMENPQGAVIQTLLTRFQALQGHYSYDDILLVDPSGAVRLSLSGNRPPLAEEAVQALAQAWHERRPVLTDLHFLTADSPPHIDVIAPLFASQAADAEPVGAVILRSNAAAYLYPLIQSWPTPSQTAETLLVRRDGDAVLFLNELRHRSGTALILRIPLSERDVPAVRAALGEEGPFEGKDYRGVDVIAYLRAIPDSPWAMVAKVDRAEVLAELETHAALILAMTLGGAVTAITLIGMIWQRNEKDHFRSLYQAEQARQASEARYRTVLLSIGDAVITTDIEGRVELLNPVAEALTGWRRDEARGKPLEEVFRIIHEETRQPVASPVQRVLQEGAVVGLANHTLLLARDGREIPIADSGAPIFDVDGNVTGVVLAFRDQTEERAAQRALEEREAYIRSILDNLPIGVAVNSADPTVTFDYVNDNFVRFYRTTREALSKPDAFWEAVYQDPAFREEIKQRVRDDIASGDPARMHWEDVPITREGEETTYISAANTRIQGSNLLLSTVWDTTARKLAEEALRESEARYRSLFENNHAVMLIIDPATGAIIDANPAASAYYGWTREELRQMRIDQINTLPPDEVRAEMRRAKEQERNHFLFKHRRADGAIRNVEVYSGPIEIYGRKLLYSIVHDITDRVQAEAQVRLNEARLQSLINLSQNNIASIQQLLERALNEAVRLMGSQIGYLCLYDEDDQTFTLTTWFGEAQQAASMPEAPTAGMPDVADLWREVVRQRSPVVVNANPALLTLAPPAEGAILTRHISVPVFSGEKIVAVAGVGNREADYTPADATQLALLMDSVWRIVEHRRTEEALRESEERYRLLIDQSPYAIGVHQDGLLVFANPAAARLLGAASPEELIGRPISSIVSPATWGAARDRIARMLQGETGLYPTEDRYVRLDGSEVPVEVSATPFIFRGRPAVQVIALDISARKRAEEALRESEERYRLLIDQSPYAIGVHQDGLLVFANPAAAQLLGAASPEELIGRPINMIVSPATWDVTRDHVARMLRGEIELYHAEDRYVRLDGSEVPVEVFATPFTFKGRPAIQVIAIDISARKRAEEAEREQHHLTEALRATSAALIGTASLEEVMATLLESIARVIPYDAADVMLLTEDDRAQIAYWRGYPPEIARYLQNLRFSVSGTRNLQQMAITGEPVVIADARDYEGWAPEPLTDWIRSYAGAPIHMRGKLIGFLNLDSRTPAFFNESHAERLQAFADLASVAIEHAQLFEQVRRYADELEQRVIERTAQLNHAKERTEAILNSSSDVIILCRTDGTISQANPAFEATFGCPAETALNQSFAYLFLPDHVPHVKETFAAVVETHQPGRLEATARCTRLGKTFDADVVLSPIIEQEGQLSGIVCSLRDISLHKQLEAQLRQTVEQAMKMNEVKSRYVSMAAHDLRNPLAVIQSAFTLLERYGDRLTAEKKREKYAAMRDSVRRMVDLLDDILVLGRAESGKLTCNPAQVDLQTCCQEIIAEVRQASNAMQFIDFSYRGTDIHPLLDAKLLWHILSNLLSNAIKYSPAESTITFTVDCTPDAVIFRVQDRGIGIPESAKVHMFESFYRAPNVGFVPGTGLGLAIVKQLVDLHGGTISFESQEGVGTTFTVRIPQATGR